MKLQHAFRIHFLSVTVVTLQRKIKLQDCLLFFLTLQNKLYPISFVSLIKLLSQCNTKLLLLHQKIIHLRGLVVSSLFIQIFHPEAINRGRSKRNQNTGLLGALIWN